MVALMHRRRGTLGDSRGLLLANPTRAIFCPVPVVNEETFREPLCNSIQTADVVLLTRSWPIGPKDRGVSGTFCDYTRRLFCFQHVPHLLFLFEFSLQLAILITQFFQLIPFCFQFSIGSQYVETLFQSP